MNLRNKPCACGSGRKLKRCCESPAAQQQRAEAVRAAMEAWVAQRQKEISELQKNQRKHYRRSSWNLVRELMMIATAVSLRPIKEESYDRD